MVGSAGPQLAPRGPISPAGGPRRAVQPRGPPWRDPSQIPAISLAAVRAARNSRVATRTTPADPRPVSAAAINMRARVRVRACVRVRANDAKMSRIGIEGSMQGQVRFRPPSRGHDSG